MKKFFLGAAVAVVFVAYSMVLRNQHSAPVIAPAPLSQSNSTGSNHTTTNSASGTSSGSQNSSSTYKDGTYTGDVENAYYGNVQVSATIQGGQITTVDFLQYPNDNPNSQYVNQQAIPYLKQEAIQAQSANVSIVTGATFTSQAFMQSLASALSKAQ